MIAETHDQVHKSQYIAQSSNMYFILGIVIVFILWCAPIYLKWKKEIFDVIEKIPGPKYYPLVGTAYLLRGATRKNIFKRLIGIVHDNGPFFKTWNGMKPEIHVTKPEHLEIIMNNSVHITKGYMYDFVKPWLGDGLLISTGSKWHQRRKMITPTFHFKILENFMEVFVDKSKQLVRHLENKTGKTFDIYPYITHCALDIIGETAMGVEINSMAGKSPEYVDSIYKISDLIMRIMFEPLKQYIYDFTEDGQQYKRHLKILHNFTKTVIADRRKLLSENINKRIIVESSTKKRLSFLDLLLESSEDKALTDEDIREEVDTFMFEGHDTTSAAMGWTIFLLANHPDIQERVYEEVREVLQDQRTPKKISQLNELKYLECCVKESLRLYPSVPFIGRKLEDDVTIAGYKVPKGVFCNLHIYYSQRNPEIYPEPDKFDPDRFLPENSVSRHPYAFIPFSAGPRNCIGQKFAMYEEKTILASIIRSYKIKPVDTMETINPISELILRPENGVSVILEKRD